MRHVAGHVLTGLAFVGVMVWAAQAQAHPSTCSNCHTPHSSVDPNSDTDYGVPLWSTKWNSDGLPTFTVYTSPLFDALGTDIGQPDGPSKLCLGCHDGSYISSKTGNPMGTTHSFNPGGGSLAQGQMTLTESHPISFTYATAYNNPNLHVPGSLKDPSSPSGLPTGGTIASDLLDSKGKVQCTSCHDVHNASAVGDPNLRFDYEADHGKTMCRACHNK
ncbi:MAG: hypothetical protein BIFFINMI_03145 [Phycisphaerae bacterium]|nr:hypothetical protein [Phycisphaerae bacterium]